MRKYRGERTIGGQLVYDRSDDLLDKATDVIEISNAGFDWGDDADEDRLLQLSVALLSDRKTSKVALTRYREFAEFLRDRLDGDEWELSASEIAEQNYRYCHEFDADPRIPDPADLDITALDLDEIPYAVEHVLCKKHEIPLSNTSYARRRKLKQARRETQSAEDTPERSEEKSDDTESDAAPVIASDGGTPRLESNENADTEFDWVEDKSIVESQ